MDEKDDFIPLVVTPEMDKRLTELREEVFQLIQRRVVKPEEALIVLHSLMSHFEQLSGFCLVAPFDPKQSGQC